jgi:hypothetical protein
VVGFWERYAGSGWGSMCASGGKLVASADTDFEVSGLQERPGLEQELVRLSSHLM